MHTWCKDCMKDYRQERAATRTEAERQVLRDRAQKRREEQPEAVAAAQAAWREKNPDYHAQWRQDNPEKVRANWIKSRYGITIEQWDALLVAQSGRCEICTEPMEQPGVDHDHACCPKQRSCGRCVRGLLCRRCNAWLGYVADDTDRMRAAIQYIEGRVLSA